MAEPKPNQGMRQPQLGGAQSRLDMGLSKQTCKHAGPRWRLQDGGPWRCPICHPPAVTRIEWEAA